MARHLPDRCVPNHTWTAAGLTLAAVGLLLVAGCTSTTNSSSAPSAPTVQAGASPAASPAVPGVSPSAASPVQVSQVQVTPSDATITLQAAAGTSSATSIDLGGWKLQAGNASVTLPADARIAPGQSVVVHAGPAPGVSPSPFAGTPSLPAAVSPVPIVRDIYLGPQADVLRQALQPGAHVVLVDPRGVNVSQFDIPRG